MRYILYLVITSLFFGGCSRSKEKTSFNSIELGRVDTIITYSEKPPLANQVISILNEKFATCVTTQQVSYLQFSTNNQSKIPFDYTYLDNRKIGIQRNNVEKSHFESLRSIEKEIKYYSIYNFIALDSYNSLLITREADSVTLHKVSKGRTSKSRKLENKGGMYPVGFNSMMKNIFPHIKKGKVLTLAAGEFDRDDKSSRLFAWIDTNTLELTPINFRMHELGDKVQKVKASTIQVDAFLNDLWIRVENDSVCYSLLNPPDTIVLKGFAPAQMAYLDSIKAVNNSPLFGMYMNPTWSDFFFLDEIDQYAVVGILPSLEQQVNNRLQLSFSFFIDFYDPEMNHNQRVELDYENLRPPIYGSGNSLYFTCDQCEAETRENEEVTARFVRLNLSENQSE